MAVADRTVHRGTLPNGMEFVAWGRGPKSLVFIQGGPGSVLPTGPMLRLTGRRFAPYVDAGYRVSMVTRRRHMPSGYTAADMADDHAQAISEALGGLADVVVGESFGGMIAQYLAARHPDRVGRVVLVASGWRVSDWGKDVDSRLAAALDRGDRTAAAMIFAEYLLPAERQRWLRRLLGPFLVRRLLAEAVPREDLRTETDVELAFDARAVLPQVTAPVLLIAGDRDRFFPPEVVRETAELIPDCTLIGYPRAGHVRTSASGKVPRDVLAFTEQRPAPQHGRRAAGAFRDVVTGGAQVLAALVTAPLVRGRYNRWGATADEVAAALPGDELVAAPRLGYTRAVTVAAPPDAVWPWLAQVGQGRGGFYSFDGLENLIGCDIHSLDVLPPDAQELQPGDLVRLAPGEQAPTFRVHEVVPPATLVLVSSGPADDGGTVATWQWVLRPVDGGLRTRLLVRQRLTYPRSQRLLWHLLEPVTFVMERRMLLGLRSRAERAGAGAASGAR